MKLIRSPLYLALLLLTQCSSCKDSDPAPEAQLPPATQTGANTFGCLINGKAYIPEGNDGTSNYMVLYDPGYNGGSLDIRTYRTTNSEDKFLLLGSAAVSATGAYSLNLNSLGSMHYTNLFAEMSCRHLDNDYDLSYRRGRLTITRLDLRAGVISGTFECTLARPGCDTVRITQGRFDKKL